MSYGNWRKDKTVFYWNFSENAEVRNYQVFVSNIKTAEHKRAVILLISLLNILLIYSKFVLLS